MQRLTRDKKFLHLRWDKSLEPRAQVEIGETIVVETANNFALYKEMKSSADVVDSMPITAVNPLTGPIWVAGAEPGDVVVVEVLDVEVVQSGHMPIIPKIGLFRNILSKPATKIWRVENEMSIFDEDIQFPSRPVVGTFGTMPDRDGYYAIHPGPHGGNLDDTNLTIGAKIHMPVFVPGALVMLGDLHASQGDSETISGIEVDGVVTIKFDRLVKNHPIPYARVETPNLWVFEADAPTMEEAMTQSAIYAAEFLMERLSLSMEDATFLLAAWGNMRISQAAFSNYNYTLRTEVPKGIDRRGRLNDAYN